MTDGPQVELTAPAKLTVSLRVTGIRADGFHLLESEMVTVDLADTLVVGDGDGLIIDEQLTGPGVGSVAGPGADGGSWRSGGVDPGPENLVARALRAVGRTARVELVKRIPPGAGLGGGSADAAAILRWAGSADPALAAGLGADIPFCLVGGRALVRGIGEEVTPLPFEERAFTLFLLPFGMDTRAVYGAWDRMHARGQLPGRGESPDGPSSGPPEPGDNDLEAPALAVEARLGVWRDYLAEVTGRRPWLAGSGSTWFVAATPAEVGLGGPSDLRLGSERALVVPVRTVPAG
jgi:4-diphosphocytidyl-2-C-methyl-D-erythritol kinase